MIYKNSKTKTWCSIPTEMLHPPQKITQQAAQQVKRGDMSGADASKLIAIAYGLSIPKL